MYDVLVIGAGPVGSYTAELLASSGYRVAVVEQRDKRDGRSCCTGILGRECVELFPVPPDVILRTASSAVFFSPSGKRIRVCKEGPQAYIVNREALDTAWAGRAREQGAEFLLGYRALAARVTREGATVACEHDRTRAELRGRALVVASGFASGLTRQLGLGDPGDFVIGAQLDVDVQDTEEVEIYLGQEVAPGFFAWLVPTMPGRGRLGLLSRHHPGTYLVKLYNRLRAQGKVLSAITPPRFGGIPLRPLPKTYASRVVVVGNAAGQVKPTTGGGVYYGLLCAQLAAEVLHQALASDDFSEERFAQYERNWKRKLYRELQIGYYARRLYERAGDSHIERVFDIMIRNGIHEALLRADDFSFDWHGGLLLKALTSHLLGGIIRALKSRLTAR